MINRYLIRIKAKINKIAGLDWVGKLDDIENKVNLMEKMVSPKNIRILMGPSFVSLAQCFALDRSLSMAFQLRGVEVIPMYIWDVATAQRLITDNVRIAYVAKQNLAVGTDTNDPEGEMKMFYDDLTEKVYVRAYFKLGVQFLHDSLVQIGY